MNIKMIFVGCICFSYSICHVVRNELLPINIFLSNTRVYKRKVDQQQNNFLFRSSICLFLSLHFSFLYFKIFKHFGLETHRDSFSTKKTCLPNAKSTCQKGILPNMMFSPICPNMSNSCSGGQDQN